MAGIPSEGLGDDFFEQILAVQPGYAGGATGDVVSIPMGLQLGSGGGGDGLRGIAGLQGGGGGGGMGMPLGLNLEQGFLRQERFRDELNNNNNNNNTTNNASSSSTASSGITVNLSFPLLISSFLLHVLQWGGTGFWGFFYALFGSSQ